MAAGQSVRDQRREDYFDDRPRKSDRDLFIRDLRRADAEQSATAKAQHPEETAPSTRPITVKLQSAAKGSTGSTVAGFGLGFFGYFLGLAFFRGGPAGARAWLAAKFLNKVGGVSPVPTTASTTGGTGTTGTTTVVQVVPASTGQPSAVLV